MTTTPRPAFKLHAVILACMLIGCSAIGESLSPTVVYNAAQIGIQDLYPQASLTVEQTTKSTYILTIVPGQFKSSSHGPDGMTIIGVKALAFYCPAWRLAKQRNLSTVTMRKQLGVDKGSEKMELTFNEFPLNNSRVATPDLGERIDFSEKSTQSVRDYYCERHP